MSAQTTQLTTVDRFRQVTSDQFEQEVDRLWQAISQIKDSVVEQVQNDAIPPMSGLGILACVTAQTLGYGLFHGQPAPADLVATLSDSGLLSGARR